MFPFCIAFRMGFKLEHVFTVIIQLTGNFLCGIEIISVSILYKSVAVAEDDRLTLTWGYKCI